MINVKLPYPPTVNTYTAVVNGRKILSKRGRVYKKEAYLELLEQTPKAGLTGRLEVRIDVYPPDRRKRDIANCEKAVCDVCQDYGIFLDDEQIDILTIRRREISKPGYVRVFISEIDDEY